MAKIELFAINLVNPSHMEWTSDGRLLVSEHTAGRIKDVTEGGDMLNKEPWAEGLNGPAAILPFSNDSIFVCEVWSGTIRNIERGGDVSKTKAVAEELSLPYGMSKRKGDDNLYISERFDSHIGRITAISTSGEKFKTEPYVRDLPAAPGIPGLSPLKGWPNNWEQFAAAGCVADWPTGGRSNKLYTTIGLMGQILDITEGGNYIDLVKANKLVAWGLGRIGGMHYNQFDDKIYAVEPEAGSVVAVDPNQSKNYRFEPRVVQGLNFPTCPRFADKGKTLLVCSSGDGVIWKITDF